MEGVQVIASGPLRLDPAQEQRGGIKVVSGGIVKVENVAPVGAFRLIGSPGPAGEPGAQGPPGPPADPELLDDLALDGGNF